MEEFSLWILPLLLIPVIGRYPYIEREHRPTFFTTERSRLASNGSPDLIADPATSPDFRIPEPLLEARSIRYFEEHRPYRMSPYKQYKHWNKADEAHLFGCYCTTVFKRLRPLAGCAVLTTRHILTTATSTELILRKRSHFTTLENVLGVWYDINSNSDNTSMYMTPARIHYHPRYVMPREVNRSHPLPVMFDLAVWASTYPLYGKWYTWARAQICNRGGSHRWGYVSPIPPPGMTVHVIGFQFIVAYGRKPMPWFRYVVKTREHIYPCPKVEWGWYHCYAGYWAPLGLDQGAALHITHYLRWSYSGLIGLNVLSMRLRSKQLIHYFINVDSHPVLDFLYDAYNGRLPYRYLDSRFEDTKNKAPNPKQGVYIPWNYPSNTQLYYNKIIPWN